jgi:hypothetical protein
MDVCKYDATKDTKIRQQTQCKKVETTIFVKEKATTFDADFS